MAVSLHHQLDICQQISYSAIHTIVITTLYKFYIPFFTFFIQ